MKGFDRAQANYDNMLPPDDSCEEARFEAACERIDNDPELLLAAVYETDCDEAEKLAKLRIVLRNASVCLRAILAGVISAGSAQHLMHLQAMLYLVDAANDAEQLVSERIKIAADEVVK